MASAIATRAEDVTCRSCWRLAERLREQEEAKKPRSITREELVLSFARAIAGPPIVRYPALEPNTYITMRCRTDSGHCSCVFCRIDEANINARLEWDLEQQDRPHRTYACDFGSFNAAMSHYVGGARGLGSALGRMQTRAKELEALGTAVQTTQRHDRDSIEIRDLVKRRDVYLAMKHAFSDEQVRRGLAFDQCVLVMCGPFWADPVQPEEWADEMGLTPRALRELWLHGRRRAEAWLAAVQYVPEPRVRVRRTEKGDRWIAEGEA
jgi:hypothetical protein